MKKQSPLQPIRRAVGESVKTIQKIVQSTSHSQRPDHARTLRYECLEDRRVLSATGIGVDVVQDSAFVTSEQADSLFEIQQEAITSITVSVNGEVQELTPENNRLQLTAGDSVEVLEIAFSSNADEGVYAVEGYVNKISDFSSTSLPDYNDGRFSDRENNFEANGGDGSVGGLTNSWTVEEGWDRLSLNLLHYTESATDVSARLFVQLQVGRPDFALDTDYLDTVLDQEITVGEPVEIPARWLNNQGGNFRNYAEVDIFHSSDPDTIVWAGALVGTASAENVVEGEFLNTRESDSFSERWTPDQEGEYLLLYTVDPENSASETNEDNNEYEIILTIGSESGPVAVDDTFEAGESFNVLENDTPTQAQVTIYENDFESDSLVWTTNPFGTDTATSGIFEVTTPDPTSFNGVQLQLEAASGERALVTGGRDDGSVGLEDIDGGLTSALSDRISIPSDASSVLSFQYNFAHLPNSSSDDFFRVSVVGETDTTEVLFERGSAENRPGEWVEATFDLTEFAGQDIQILVEAADNGTRSLVEAGIDDVKIEIPQTPLAVNEYTQGENGTVLLNEDGTFNYTADAGFVGEDQFEYSVTDGENSSRFATVTVNVGARDFDVKSETAGDEDTAIALNIETEFESVEITGVPQDAVLNRGQAIGNGVYQVDSNELAGLTITPSENSDVDFQLTVTPVDGGTAVDGLAQKIDVVVNAVVDGGQVAISDFGILTGTSGRLPALAEFIDLDGSETAQVIFSGLPEFVALSSGTQVGTDWVVDASDIGRLEIEADVVADTSDWNNRGRFVFRAYEINYTVESFEQAGGVSRTTENAFEFFAVQEV